MVAQHTVGDGSAALGVLAMHWEGLVLPRLQALTEKFQLQVYEP